MKGIHYFFIICLTITSERCVGQTNPKREIYNQDFRWTVTIPEGFDSVSTEQWTKMQNKGADAVEKTYDEKVINNSKTIFVFRSGKLNYLESNYQPFDTAIDGNYFESCRNVNEILYQTFVTQMKDVKIDTATSTEKIDNLEFQTFRLKITYPNNMVMNAFLFTRLFDKKEFSVNIMYVDNEKGELMLDAWKKSKFGIK